MEPIYIVLIIIVIIWLGIFGYMLHLDKQIKNLQDKFENLQKEKRKVT